MLTSQQIRAAVAQILTTAFPTAAVFPRWALGFELGDCPAVLRESNGQGRVNGWLISVTDFNREFGDEEEETACVDTFVLRIWHVLDFSQGDNTTNSQDEFEANLQAAQNAFSNQPGLGLDTYYLRHDQLRFVEADIYPFGEKRCHLAKGTLTVGVQNFTVAE